MRRTSGQYHGSVLVYKIFFHFVWLWLVNKLSLFMTVEKVFFMVNHFFIRSLCTSSFSFECHKKYWQGSCLLKLEQTISDRRKILVFRVVCHHFCRISNWCSIFLKKHFVTFRTRYYPKSTNPWLFSYKFFNST